MKTSKLKNIIITILLLLNVFLLGLLVSLRAEERAAYDRSITQLVELYAANNVALDRALLPQNAVLPTLSPSRDLAAEQAFAEALLGSVTTVDSGGGIYRYYAVSPGEGVCVFRSSGAFSATVSREVDDPVHFCETLCASFGYSLPMMPRGAEEVITAERKIGGVAVYNCGLRFTFSGSTLLSVSGFFLPDVELSGEGTPPDVVSTLVRFLDYRNASGLICTEIVGVDLGYLLQSTASAPLQTVPVVRIATDVSSYYVNLSSGEIVRQSTSSVQEGETQ